MKPSRNLREYASSTTFRLLAGGVGILFVIGLTLILIIYGPNAAMLGFLCLITGLAPIALVLVFLRILDWIANRDQ